MLCEMNPHGWTGGWVTTSYDITLYRGVLGPAPKISIQCSSRFRGGEGQVVSSP